jgi:hypothetical protein
MQTLYHKQRNLIQWALLALGLSLFLASCQSEDEKRQNALQAAKKEGYAEGYTDGYNAAKSENDATYQQGYEAARQEIARNVAIRYGITGFLAGFLAGVGGVVVIARKTVLSRVNDVRKKYELRKAFENIPTGLPPDVYDDADRIAHIYANILEQFRSTKGYTLSEYTERWRPRLKELMKKATQLLELIQELETTRKHVNQQKLEHTIADLQYTVRHAKDDEARHTAMTSLNRAKQTLHDLVRTKRNIEHCKTALQGIIGVLESMHLKLSNLKVNTQRTDLLEELSSDLEAEMAALEAALQEVSA